MKTRIEQDPETGDIFLLLPDEVVEDYQIEIGDTVEVTLDEDGITIEF